MALKRFMEYAVGHEGVWFPRRIDIARHWAAQHPPKPRPRPSAMTKDDFVAAYGGIFEHSPWIAERAWALELGPAHDCAAGVHNALARIFRAASEEERLGVLNAHPDLAGKLAAAKRLTAESTAEQASAGLDALTDAERAAFTRLNTAYVDRFGFPFIIAVRDHDKAGILAAFERRIANDRATEFAEACRQVERIAELRLQAILP
jgi:OHCU decarboxylase